MANTAAALADEDSMMLGSCKLAVVLVFHDDLTVQLIDMETQQVPASLSADDPIQSFPESIHMDQQNYAETPMEQDEVVAQVECECGVQVSGVQSCLPDVLVLTWPRSKIVILALAMAVNDGSIYGKALHVECRLCH